SALSTLGIKLEEDRREALKEGNGKDEDSPDDGKAGKGKGGSAGTDAGKDRDDDKSAGADDIVLMELAVLPNSGLAGRSARDINLRARYGINLLAVSRQGKRSMARLRAMTLRAGDV